MVWGTRTSWKNWPQMVLFPPSFTTMASSPNTCWQICGTCAEVMGVPWYSRCSSSWRRRAAQPCRSLPSQARAPPFSALHTIEAIEDSVVVEVSTPELDDVVRLSDRYGRVASDPGGGAATSRPESWLG